MANRYNQLNDLIRLHKPTKICEVGTWNGLRAKLMIEEALKYSPSVEYWGFDLFEEASDETDSRELNVKPHHTLDEVQADLDATFKDRPVAITLTRGDTRETLRAFTDSASLDFVFIDGGHSVETIANDYEALKDAKVVILDDYYVKDANGDMPDITKYGCNSLIDGKDNTILPIADPVRTGGMVQMAVMGLKNAGKSKIVIKTLNCVRDEKIRGNIRYATSIIPADKWVKGPGKPTNTRVIMCGSGPSLAASYDFIRERQAKGDLVVTVKSAHHQLIAAGIIPWGCVLLDPRIDVLKWVTPLHPDVRYFVASMCYPDVVEHVVDGKVKYHGYHALVGAGENEVLSEYDERAEQEAKAKGTPFVRSWMVTGGSTAALRGIALFHNLGVRHFDLVGYDSCYYEKPDMSVMTKMGKPRFSSVAVAGKDFWTDSQLLAQCQDFHGFANAAIEKDLDVTVHGDGMLAWVASKLLKPRPSFDEQFGDPAPVTEVLYGAPAGGAMAQAAE